MGGNSGAMGQKRWQGGILATLLGEEDNGHRGDGGGGS